MHQHYQSYCQIKQGKLKVYLPRRIEAAAKGKKSSNYPQYKSINRKVKINKYKLNGDRTYFLT